METVFNVPQKPTEIDKGFVCKSILTVTPIQDKQVNASVVMEDIHLIEAHV